MMIRQPEELLQKLLQPHSRQLPGQALSLSPHLPKQAPASQAQLGKGLLQVV